MTATATKKVKTSTPAAIDQDHARPIEGIMASVPVSRIDIDNRNDRDVEAIDKEAIRQLAESIGLHGLQQPLGVVNKPDGRYRLVFGHRRLEAVKSLGWEEVDCRVMGRLDDDVIQEIRAVENLQRQDLNYVEEAFAVAGMVQSFEDIKFGQNEANDKDLRDKAIAHVAKHIGKTEQWVRDRSFLSRASTKVRAFCRDGSLPFPHAREIVKLTSEERQDEVAELARAGRARWQGGKPDPLEPPMPIDELRKLVGKNLFSLAQVPWKLDVPFAGAMPCDRCTKNSANQTGLFEHAAPNKGTGYQSTYKEPAAGICTDAACFKAKEIEHRKAVRAAAGKFLKQPKPIKDIRASKTTGGNEITHGKLPAASPASVSQFVPDFVAPAAVVREIKDREARVKERAAAAGKPAPKKSGSKYTTYMDQPGYKAKSKYDAALDKWSKSAKEAMRAQCKGDPILGLSLSLLSFNKAALATQDDVDYTGKLKKTGKRLTPNACADVVARAIPMKTLAQLSVLAGEVEDTDVDLDGPQHNFQKCRGVFEATCTALGIPLGGPRPEFAEYLAMETGSAAAKAAAKKPAKGPKGKKDKASKSAGEEVDDAD